MFNIVTHHRFFHTDEVMATALLDLFLLNGKYNLIRTRDNQTITKHQNNKNSFVVDVGLKFNEEKLNFDHHQNDKSLKWSDGTLYSSCGLIWNYLKKNNHLNINKQLIMFIEETVIKNVDRQDNGISKWNDGYIVTMYNRNHHDDKVLDKQFLKAVNTCKDYIVNIINADFTGQKMHSFSISNGIFISLLNTYLKQVDYDIIFDKKLSIKINSYQDIKEEALFKEAIQSFDCVKLFDYLEKSNIYTQFMNKIVFTEFKNTCFDIINDDVKAMFLKMYQFDTKLDTLTQFKKSLKVTQDFTFNVFSKVKNEIKSFKAIEKCVKKSDNLKDIVLLDSNIKEAACYTAKHTDKKILIIPRTKNSWKIQAIPITHDKPFTKRISMPKKWLGLSEKELQYTSGIKELIFCHKGGFMCMYNGNKDQVIKFVNDYIL